MPIPIKKKISGRHLKQVDIDGLCHDMRECKHAPMTEETKTVHSKPECFTDEIHEARRQLERKWKASGLNWKLIVKSTARSDKL